MNPSDVILDICLSLSILMNIYQMMFWSKQNQALVDKVMSRNYAEYSQMTSKPEIKPLQLSPDVSDDEVLGELNRHLPV